MTADPGIALAFFAMVCMTAALTAAGVHVGTHALKQVAQTMKRF